MTANRFGPSWREYRQYTESADAEIDADRRIVLNTLLQDARGYDNRISAKALAEETNINYSTVRDVIGELRAEFNVPVGNVGSGYFVIETNDELDRVVENLRGEIETREERLQTLVANYNQQTYE